MAKTRLQNKWENILFLQKVQAKKTIWPISDVLSGF